MYSRHLPHKHGSHKTLWIALISAVVVVVGSILFGYAQGQKKQAEKMNSTKAVPNDAELRRQLSKDQYHVTRECGTETPFQNAYWDNHKPGIYVDLITGEALFSSLDKFDSGGLAQFHEADFKRQSNRKEGFFPRHGADGGSLKSERFASWSRFRRWPRADRGALLCELCRAPFYSSGEIKRRRL